MDDLMSEFVAETRETLEAIAGEIVAWEAQPGDRARLDAIFRFVHTVKGSCGFLDLHRLERLSHAAEDALAAVRSDLRVPDARLVNAVLKIIDRIGEIVEAIDTGGSVADGDDDQLIAALAVQPVQAEPAEPQAAPAARAGSRAPTRSIRLPVELLDRMMSGVSDMVLARNELMRRMREVAPDTGLEAAFERLSGCVAEMRDAIARTRMQRVDNLFTALPRMVRDLSAELGKAVTLDIDGGDVELDREMIEMIRDPLTHIVRNAVDHGIERPADRQRAGKPAAGALRICARQSGNQILIDISDDGRGIDADRLVARATAEGRLAPDLAQRMTPAERLDLIFEPGLSTASAVTAISGRGVGMDVVRANVERIGGVVEIESRAGHGTKLTLRVPLTLTIIPALTVGSCGHQFAIPRSTIEEIVRTGSNAIRLEQVGGAALAFIRGRRLPVVDLADIIGEERAGEATTLVVLKQAGGAHFALLVEIVHDHEELVVKPAAPALMATGLYAGTTLPDDGRPMLLLDTAGIAAAGGIASGDEAMAETERHAAATGAAATDGVPVLLFRDTDGAERGIRLALVERIEDVPAAALSHAGGQLRFVRDGRVLPLVAAAALDRSAQRVLRLGDGRAEIGYAIAEIIDIATIDPNLAPPGESGRVAGVALVSGRLVEILDVHALFAAAGGAQLPSDERPACLLTGAETGWAREILAPLVEAAGYRTIWNGDPAAASACLAIDCGGADPSPALPASVARLRLSDRPGTAGAIWRYDRDGILSALSAGRAGGVR